MKTIKIKGFDPNRLEELAKEQTEIYNAANANLAVWKIYSLK